MQVVPFIILDHHKGAQRNPWHITIPFDLLVRIVGPKIAHFKGFWQLAWAKNSLKPLVCAPQVV